MARQDVKTRLVTQLSHVSGALEEIFFYPEAAEYEEILRLAQDFVRLLARYIMEKERVATAGMQRQPLESAFLRDEGSPGFPERAHSDFAAEQALVAGNRDIGGNL